MRLGRRQIWTGRSKRQGALRRASVRSAGQAQRGREQLVLVVPGAEGEVSSHRILKAFKEGSWASAVENFHWSIS